MKQVEVHTLGITTVYTSFSTVNSENIHTPTEAFLFHFHPCRNSSLGSYCTLQFWLLKPPTHSEFPMTFYGVGILDIFRDRTLHDCNINNCNAKQVRKLPRAIECKEKRTTEFYMCGI